MTSFAFSQTLPTSGNLVYIEQVGSNNTIYVEQKDLDIKAASVVNKGDNNDFAISQQGLGTHIAAITPSSNAPNSVNNNNVIAYNRVAPVIIQQASCLMILWLTATMLRA